MFSPGVVWDGEGGKSNGEPLKGYGDAETRLASSPDGTRFVAVSLEGTARVWDAQSGKPIGEPLEGHQVRVMSAAFSPDGKRIFTASGDGMALIRDAESGKPIREPLEGHQVRVMSAAFSPDGKRIRAVSFEGELVEWEVLPNTQALVSAVKSAVPRCLTPVQRKAFFLPPEPPAWCIEMAKWPYDTPEWTHWLADKRAGKSPPLPAE
jgi:WD40 repeat protein